MKLFPFIIVFFITFSTFGVCSSETKFTNNSQSTNQAYHSNEIGSEEFIIRTLKSYFDPPKPSMMLTKEYVTKPTRQITLLLHEARKNYHLYSDESKKYLDILFKRPVDSGYEEEDGVEYGIHLPQPVSSFEPDAVQYPNIGGKFKFWYVTHSSADNGGVVHTTTLDFVKKMADAFENVYEIEINDMGYPAPPRDDLLTTDNGGDAKFDVYIMNCLPKDVYGYVVPGDYANNKEGPDPTANAYTSFMVMDNDYIEVVTDTQTSEDAMKVTAAHEFHHAIQFGINIEASTWYCETTSTWMEDQVYDSINNNLIYLDDFFKYPKISLDFFSNDTVELGYADHEYGTWIWNEFLEKKYDQNAIKQVWENLDPWENDNAIDAISTMLISKGSTLKDSFTEFVAKNYSKLNFYKDALSYPDVWIENDSYDDPNPHMLDETNSQVSQQSVSVSHLASKYYKFIPGTEMTTVKSLTINVDGDDNKELDAIVVVKYTDGSYSEGTYFLDAITNQDSIVIYEFNSENISEVVLGLINYSKTDDDLEIKYSASLTENLSKIVLSSPSGAINNPPVFTWADDINATWYRLLVWNSSEEKIIGQWYDASDICSDGSCTVTVESELAIDSYKWWVKSYNSLGSLWSDGMDFTISPPSKVTHTSPLGTTQDLTPTFTWKEDPASTWYKLWAGYPDDQKIFAQWYEASDICSDDSCSVTLETELMDGNYEWYIKSWNDYGKIWSDGMSFSLGE